MKSDIKTSISIFLVPFWYFCEHISISCWRVVVYRELLPHIRIIILLTLCPGSLQRGHKRGVVIILNSLAPDSDHYPSWPIVTRKQELETMYYSVGFHVPHSVELKCKKYNVSDLSLCIFFSIHDYFLIATASILWRCYVESWLCKFWDSFLLLRNTTGGWCIIPFCHHCSCVGIILHVSEPVAKKSLLPYKLLQTINFTFVESQI